MDGVLIEAKDWHYEALNKALRIFGYEIKRYDHLSTFDGLPTKDKLKMLSIENNLPIELNPFINEMKQRFTMDIAHVNCKPVFYLQYALSKFKDEKYKLAVCSNSVRNSVKVMMEKSALLEYLDFYLSNEDVKKSKPDPEIYNNAINRLKLSPKECLIIEDNPNGVKAAIASGAHVMKVDKITDVNYFNISNFIKSL